MDIGKLRHRITIQYLRINQDGYGQIVDTEENWQDFKAVWAAIYPATGKEYFSSSKENTEILIKAAIRYTSGITPGMRIVFGSRVFEIVSVINPEERKNELELMCRERV